jgi:chromosomal replication initiation ATPase DnaA
MTDQWPKRQTILTGPRFSGKTHLSRIWQNLTNAVYLNPDHKVKLTHPIIIDELDDYYDEEFLLTLMYELEDSTLPALWITNKSLENYAITIDDLRTRLNSLVTLQIGEPSELLLENILKKRCLDFGLSITNEAVRYSMDHLELTYSAINTFVIKLHLTCLINQRPPSIFTIQDILARQR